MPPKSQLERDGFVRLRDLATTSGISPEDLLRRALSQGTGIHLYLGDRVVRYHDGMEQVNASAEEIEEAIDDWPDPRDPLDLQSAGECSEAEWEGRRKLVDAGKMMVERLHNVSTAVELVRADVVALITNGAAVVREVGVKSRGDAVHLESAEQIAIDDAVIDLRDSATLTAEPAEGASNTLSNTSRRPSSGSNRAGRRLVTDLKLLAGLSVLVFDDVNDPHAALNWIGTEAKMRGVEIEEKACASLLEAASDLAVRDSVDPRSCDAELLRTVLTLLVALLLERGEYQLGNNGAGYVAIVKAMNKVASEKIGQAPALPSKNTVKGRLIDLRAEAEDRGYIGQISLRVN